MLGKIATFAATGALLVLVQALLSEGTAAMAISGVFAVVFFVCFVGLLRRSFIERF